MAAAKVEDGGSLVLVHVFEHSDHQELTRRLLRIIAVVADLFVVEDAVELVSNAEADGRVLVPDQVGSQGILSGEKREKLKLEIVVLNSEAEQIVLPRLFRNLLCGGKKFRNLEWFGDSLDAAVAEQFGFSSDFSTSC